MDTVFIQRSTEKLAGSWLAAGSWPAVDSYVFKYYNVCLPVFTSVLSVFRVPRLVGVVVVFISYTLYIEHMFKIVIDHGL